ncbi:MAG: hypothetical protein KatS3mg118_3176 [Paracoccaceae bacterium]|nr:MAG: hypothetical protein KatS3mg118_3176 [Paracoccaceae bacterium]
MTEAQAAWGREVLLSVEDGIAWVTLNRPDKRNAINPGIVREMNAVLDAVEEDDAARVLVLTGAGSAFSAGQDLKEYFREPDQGPPPGAASGCWRPMPPGEWRRMRFFPKPTIAMVNGWCFGGAFQVLIACDLAIAAEDARFGLSEINWGIIPAGIVTRRGGRRDEPARRALLHHDRRDLRRPRGRGDAAGEPRRARRPAAGRDRGAGPAADGEEPARPARGQDGLSPCPGRCPGNRPSTICWPSRTRRNTATPNAAIRRGSASSWTRRAIRPGAAGLPPRWLTRWRGSWRRARSRSSAPRPARGRWPQTSSAISTGSASAARCIWSARGGRGGDRRPAGPGLGRGAARGRRCRGADPARAAGAPGAGSLRAAGCGRGAGPVRGLCRDRPRWPGPSRRRWPRPPAPPAWR